MIYANDDAQYDQLKKEMIEKAKGLGYDEIINWTVVQTKKVFELRKQS